MGLSSKQRFELKRIVQEVENFRGRHTELVSVYVPAGYDMNKVVNHLCQEQGTATNIKSTSTRKNVIDALERMIQHLRLYSQTPPNGLVAFSGNVAEREGQSDVKVWSIEPPVPLKTRVYLCDKQFHLDPLREMMEIKEAYGLVVMDRREGDVAFLKGKSIIPISSAKSNVPGKTRAGGQSAARYMRLREDAAKDFYKKIADMMKDAFLAHTELKGIIVGGPGPTKYEFIDGGYITGDVKKKIIAIKDLSYTGDFGLTELVDKSDDVLSKEDIAEEKKIMTRFFDTLAKRPNMVTYGKDEVFRCLEAGMVDIVLVSENKDTALITELDEKAVLYGSTLKIISIETREGVQLNSIGGLAAILRYETA